MHPTLLLGGKREGQALGATGVPGQNPSRLFYVTDRLSGTRFLVDTGAEVSVIPPSQAERKHKQEEYTLQAVNHTAIPTFGNRSLTLDIGLRRTFRWIFVIADLKNPILGADFLRHYSLMVDVKRNKLLDSLTQLEIQGVTAQASSPSPTIGPQQHGNAYEAILAEFPTLTQPCYHDLPVKHVSLIT